MTQGSLAEDRQLKNGDKTQAETERDPWRWVKEPPRKLRAAFRAGALLVVGVLLCLFANAALRAISCGVESLGRPEMVSTALTNRSDSSRAEPQVHSASPPASPESSTSTPPTEANGRPVARGETTSPATLTAVDGSNAPVVIPFVTSLLAAIMGMVVTMFGLIALVRDE